MIEIARRVAGILVLDDAARVAITGLLGVARVLHNVEQVRDHSGFGLRVGDEVMHPRAAVKRIIARVAIQPVVAGAALQRIVAFAAIQLVVALAALQRNAASGNAASGIRHVSGSFPALEAGRTPVRNGESPRARTGRAKAAPAAGGNEPIRKVMPGPRLNP